jgi:glycosyltransferase involved in cell wall biosynthesis
MLRRAVRSFDSQTYQNKQLLIFDSVPGLTFGALRNAANASAQGDIIVHFDDDDLSHRRRIEEQVALLQISGKECVGYNKMLFWDTRGPGEAWLYTNSDPRFVLDTSACYWASSWLKTPFPESTNGNADYLRWVKNADTYKGISSVAWRNQPGMIASIHDGNRINPAYDKRENNVSWLRVPTWDEHCARVMELNP